MPTVLLALRVVVALGAVFGALLFAHRWITKGRPGSPLKAKRIAVVARQGLGQKAGVAIVDAGGRRYLLGVTEHAVTVLDTLGAAEAADPAEPVLVSAEPVGAAAFEQELRQVQVGTGTVPVLVHGRRDPRDPTGPITTTIAITSAAPADVVVTRRALREAEQRREAVEAGPLAGSVLSPTTWRQTFDAVKRLR